MAHLWGQMTDRPARIARFLRQELENCPPERRLPVIITLAPGSKSGATLRRLSSELPVDRSFQLLPAATLRASPSEIRLLAQDDRIARIWLDVLCHTCLDRSARTVSAPFAWRSGWTGRGALVGQVDTGVDEKHPDLAGRIAAQRDFSGEGEGDGNGHGTHVAGIIAGSGIASGGKYRGIAPDAQLVVAKALGADGGGATSNVIAALEWAVNQGVKVVNMSLGFNGPADGTDPLSLAVDAATARGCLVVAAAGNSGPDASSVGAPAAARTALAVGAIARAGQVTQFSSRGPTADGRSKPDLVAPGEGIISCRARSSAGQTIDGYYTPSSGTSMAAPHVAGAAALLLQANPNLTVDDLLDALLTAAPLESSSDPNEVGKGMLTIDQALTVAPRPGRRPVGRNGCLASLIPLLVELRRLLAGRPG